MFWCFLESGCFGYPISIEGYPKYQRVPQNGGSCMPKRIIPLSDIKVQKVKPKDKPFSSFDGDGLYLLVILSTIIQIQSVY
jgi:hypothetical protein